MIRERRKNPRERVNLPQGLRISVAGSSTGARQLMVKLVDASPGGIGVECFTRIPTGATVTIDGDLRSSDVPLTVTGRARVVHSTKNRNGLYSIGLQFERLSYAKTA